MAILFARDLQAMPGAAHMLASLDCAFCIASSGPIDKIKHALQIKNLAHYFGDRVFSSYTIQSWKPEPGLFLHAAEQMGFAAHECIVIEDSAVGLEAAHQARMKALHYQPNNLSPNVFSHLLDLPLLLATATA